MAEFTPSPTGQEFMDSREFVKIIMGPVGGGKSTVCLFDLLCRATDQVPVNNVRRTKFGILRNTVQQLRSTVKPLIDQWFGSLPGAQWRHTDGIFEMRMTQPDGTIMHTELMLLSADTPDDVRRLLSLELSAAWVEESREVDPEVFNGLQGRVGRFPNRASGGVTYPGVICSTNPPPMGTFWHKIISAPPKGYASFLQPAALLDDGSINPEAENTENLPPDYYEKLVEGKNEAWVDVYLKNQYGPGAYGNPVFRSSFKRSFHVAKNPLQPVLQSINPLIVGMDNGLTGAVVFMQQDMRGRVLVFGSEQVPEGETMGSEKFLDKFVIPRLANSFPFRRENIVFEMDPACFARSQVNEATIAEAVQRRGFKVNRAATNDPERRVSAVEGLLDRQVDGEAAILFDPSATTLIDAMDWGYRYKKTLSVAGKPSVDKTHHSHVAEALQYGCLRYNQTLSGQQVLARAKARPIARKAFAYV